MPKTAAEIIAALKIKVEAAVVAKLDKHLAVTHALIKPEWELHYEELSLVAFGGTLYFQFIPGLAGSAPTDNVGEGAFIGRSNFIPAIYLPGDPYKLVIGENYAALYYGPFLAWSGIGEQFGLVGTYNVTFVSPFIVT